MAFENMGGAAAPVISLDDTGLNTRRRQQAEASGALAPPLPLEDFATETPMSQEAIVSERPAFAGQSRSMFLILVGMLVAVGMVHFTGESEDPFENFAAFFRDTFSMSFEDDSFSVASNPAAEELPPLPAPEEAAEAGFTADMVPNPYWMLPNELEKGQRSTEPVTPAKAEEYTNGLNHRFTYQRYRTVQDIRVGKKLGSAAYLAKATGEPKFWTRMEGGLGLIEQGYALDTASVERLIGDARPSLVYNYMQRFVKAPKSSDIYFMKQALRLVDARTRLHILKILARDKERHALYFAAAQYDPSTVVTDWLIEAYGEEAVSAEVLKNYQSIAMQDILRRGQAAPMRQESMEAPVVGGAITVRAEEIKIDEDVVEDVTVFEEQDVPTIPDADEVFSQPEEGSDGFDDLTKLRGQE